MRTRKGVVLYVLTLVIVVVGVDLLFLQHHFWARLFVNIAIVVAFATVYVRLARRGGEPG